MKKLKKKRDLKRENRKLSILIVISFILTIICLIFIYHAYLSYNVLFNLVIDNQKYIFKNETILDEGDPLPVEVAKIKELAYTIALHPANLNILTGRVYDCTNYASDLVKLLKENNFSAVCVMGYIEPRKRNIFHDWVKVNLKGGNVLYIEATDGVIIRKEEYKLYYHPLLEGRCL